jgi:uncharacterized protein (DUF3084 family)
LGSGAWHTIMGAALFIAFVLFVTGGVTAYMGDRLGSYIGKKRHSTFGMRPRHTAMLWTVVSGGGIAVGTLLLLLAWDNTVKTALLQGPQLVASKARLERQNSALTRQNLAAERQALADGQRADAAQAQAQSAQRTLSQVTGRLGLVAGRLGLAQQTLTVSRDALAGRQADLQAAQGQLAGARADLGHTRADLALAAGRVLSARRGVALAQRQFRVASGQVLRANQSVLSLAKRQDALYADNARLVQRSRMQASLVQEAQGRTLVFRRDEELGRTVVSTGQTAIALRHELAVFLDGVELSARRRGAGGLDQSPAITLPDLGTEPMGSVAAREAALDALSQNIAAQGGFMPSIVVVADARFNTFRGEPVKLDLRPYSNVMVFPKGTVIASSTLDGALPEDQILNRLQAFLTGQVRAAALARGIIPTHDPQTGEPLVGQPLERSDWLSLVKHIQQAGPGARITAVAAADTYSADMLRLELPVSPGAAKADVRVE